MSATSRIEWTDATWNPIVGCSLVSPGCTHCYAMKMAARIENIDAAERLRVFASHQHLDEMHPEGRDPARAQMLEPRTHYAGTTGQMNGHTVWSGKVRRAPLNIMTQPLHWRRPRRVFVNSMGDLFHESVGDEWIDQVFAVMAMAPQHTFQVLTKRPGRMRKYLTGATPEILRDRWYRAVPAGLWPVSVAEAYAAIHADASDEIRNLYDRPRLHWPLRNVWLGVSTEDQKRADERVPELLQTPAALHFISAEPLLGPLRLDRIQEWADRFEDCGGHPDPHWPNDTHDWTWLNALSGRYEAEARAPDKTRLGDIDVGLRWTGGKIRLVIAGGESGPKARPMHPDWLRSLRDQCAKAGTPFFFKQWGEWVSIYDRDRDDPDWRHVPKAGDWDRKRFLNLAGGQGFHGDKLNMMRRVGKRRAGRLLDGIEHNGMPRIISAAERHALEDI